MALARSAQFVPRGKWETGGQQVRFLENVELRGNDVQNYIGALEGRDLTLVGTGSTALHNVLHVLAGHGAYLQTAIFSPDRHIVLVAYANGISETWSLSSRVCLRILEGSASQVRPAVFPHSGKEVVTVSIDGAAKAWPAASGVRSVLTRVPGCRG